LIKIQVTGVSQTLNGLRQEVDAYTTDLLTNFTTEVIPRTPIDTGLARKSWQKRLNGKEKSVINTAPHITALEQGRSRQAPNGFVNQSLAAAIAKTPKRIIK